jgi:hypothetical protein
MITSNQSNQSLSKMSHFLSLWAVALNVWMFWNPCPSVKLRFNKYQLLVPVFMLGFFLSLFYLVWWREYKTNACKMIHEIMNPDINLKHHLFDYVAVSFRVNSQGLFCKIWGPRPNNMSGRLNRRLVIFSITPEQLNI